MHVSLRAKLLALAGMVVAGGDAYGPPTIGRGRRGGRAAGGAGGGRERTRNGARELFEGDPSSVIQEAFDENGTSLGYSHDAASNWSLSQILSEVILSEDITEDLPFMYHANASY